jgi:hypothetical protein
LFAGVRSVDKFSTLMMVQKDRKRFKSFKIFIEMKTIIKISFYLTMETELSDRGQVSKITREEFVPILNKHIFTSLKGGILTKKQKQDLLDKLGTFTASVSDETPGSPKSDVN